MSHDEIKCQNQIREMVSNTGIWRYESLARELL